MMFKLRLLQGSGKKILIAAGLLSLTACSVNSFRNIVEPAAKWDFIKSVGGLSLGQPRIDDNIFWLPIDVDLSGNRQITVAPTMQNSGVKCIRAELIQGNMLTRPVGYYDLHLRVFHGDDSKRQEGSCEEVPLFVGSLSPPLTQPRSVKFRIWYKDYAFSDILIGEVSL
jgi:hypothetical protein